MSIEAGTTKLAQGAFPTNTQTESYKDIGSFDSIRASMNSQSRADLVDFQISNQLGDTRGTRSDSIDFTPTTDDTRTKSKDDYQTGVHGEERAERQRVPRDAASKKEHDAADRTADPNASPLERAAAAPEAADMPPGSTRPVLNGRGEVTEFLYKDKSGNVHRLPYNDFKEMKPGTSRDFPPGFRVERETMRDLPGGFWVRTPDGQRFQLNPVGRLIPPES